MIITTHSDFDLVLYIANPNQNGGLLHPNSLLFLQLLPLAKHHIIQYLLEYRLMVKLEQHQIGVLSLN